MNEEIKNKENKKIVALAVIIATLMISATGATYAWFALSVNNTTEISGSTAQVSSTLNVTKVLPASGSTNTGVMVPQYSATGNKNALKQAIDGGCVDANKNIACQVYRIEFHNTSTAGMRASATLTLTSTMTNLKWYTIKTESNVASVPTSPTYTYPGSMTDAYGNLKAVTALGSSELIDANKYRYWYVVIWVEEKGEDQYSADGNKNFTGVVQIDSTDANGNARGITSTFTGA